MSYFYPTVKRLRPSKHDWNEVLQPNALLRLLSCFQGQLQTSIILLKSVTTWKRKKYQPVGFATSRRLSLSKQKWVNLIQRYSTQHIALTDNNLHGAQEFHRACTQYGITPIIGLLVYIETDSLLYLHYAKPVYRIVLLAENESGFRNLVRISSESYKTQADFLPYVTEEFLFRHTDDLICLSGTGRDSLTHLLTVFDSKLYHLLYILDKSFGHKRFYLSLQRSPCDNTQESPTLEASCTLDIPLAAVQEVRFIQTEDADAAHVLQEIGNKHGTSLNPLTDDHYLLSQEEISSRFTDIPEAVENTIKIAERCTQYDLFPGPVKIAEQCTQYDLFPGPVPPPFATPPGYQDAHSYLQHLVKKNLQNRYTKLTEEINTKAKYELSVIERLGYSSYFLIIHDLISYAKHQGIQVGAGRGAAPGSLVNYALGITDIDPLIHGLYFELFLNPERNMLPDISIDVDPKHRDLLLSYLHDRYGDNHVCLLTTFSKLYGPSLLKAIGDTIGLGYEEIRPLLDSESSFHRNTLIDRLTRAESETPFGRLRTIYEKLEGLPSGISYHPTGTGITRYTLGTDIPCRRLPGYTLLSCDFDCLSAEAAGLIKLEIRGLETLTRIKELASSCMKPNLHHYKSSQA
ncbi:DNA polymerase III subunit alpha [subsurface metagenome]